MRADNRDRVIERLQKNCPSVTHIRVVKAARLTEPERLANESRECRTALLFNNR